MSIVIIAPGRDRNPWIEGIKRIDATIKVEIYPDIEDLGRVEGAILWKYPYGVLSEFPNIKWITSIGAGVDYILGDPYLPTGVKLTRIVDRNLARDMKRTACMAVLNYEHRMESYYEQDRSGMWNPLSRNRVMTIGILGMGEMGRSVASGLLELSYHVRGYSRRGKSIPGIEAFGGRDIPHEFLDEIDVLISILPLTPETTGILNLRLFDRFSKPCYLINLGRGRNLVEADLLSALDTGQVSGAWLDVFSQEPLPAEHAFWDRPEITITPHVASITDPDTASEVIVEIYHRLTEGRMLLHTVDLKRGY